MIQTQLPTISLKTSETSCFQRIREILSSSRNQALQTVNFAMVKAYWEIGREIIEEEQRGKNRANYGEYLLIELAKNLSREFGKGFTERNLRYIRSFYEAFPIRNALSSKLSWTHYRLLSKISRQETRSFYLTECIKARWSTRELERQISSLLYDRLARSKDKEGLLALSLEGHEVFSPTDLIKDPYVLEFTGLAENKKFKESDLEQALIDHLQKFILELGKDLFFVARQQRITVDGDHFYIDLVFYHRKLRCFVLIDLKTGKLTHEDVGQMLFYTGYYTKEKTEEDENPPIGLILCADKNDAVVKYTLRESQRKILPSRYQIHLPTEKQLTEELQRERLKFEQELKLNKDTQKDTQNES